MRFHLGEMPEDDTFDPASEGWIHLREPATGRLMLAAVPLGVAMAAAAVATWSLIAPVSEWNRAWSSFSFTITLPALLGWIGLLLGFVLLHELLHAVPVAMTGSWDELVLGFWPRHLAPYFATTGPVPRNVQLASGALPLVTLTVLPIVVGAALSARSAWLIALSALNAAASGADLIVLFLYARQIPSTALVRNKGDSTWWKEPAV